MEKSNKKIVLLICIALLVIASIAVAIWIVTNKNSNPSIDSNTNTNTNTNTSTNTNTGGGSNTSKPSHVHTPEIIPAKAATCTETGLTEGEKCSECGEILVEQKETPLSKTHVYENAYVCPACNQDLEPSEGLEYVLSDNYGLFYTWVGIGTCTDEKIVIPRKYNGIPVTTIDLESEDLNGATSVMIPNTVRHIGFYGCRVPKGTTIYCERESRHPDWDLDWCDRFGDIVWDCNYNDTSTFGIIYTVIDGIRYSIYDGKAKVADNPCNIKINSATIKPVITYRGKDYDVVQVDGFSECKNLTEVFIPDGIEIWYSAFSGCTNLKTVVMGNGITEINPSTFENCTSLTSIKIPNSVRTIDSSAFKGCTNLKTVVMGNSITEIKQEAFMNCTSLSSIEIPESVLSIGKNAFKNCTSLTKIYIPKMATFVYSSVFENCQNLTIYCGATSASSNWEEDWNSSNCPVVWGHNHSYTGGECVCGTKQN